MTAAYAATKAYVLSLCSRWPRSCRGTGVTVTCLCPGPTATGFQARADMADSALIRTGARLGGVGRGCRLRGDEGGQALPRDRRHQQGVRVRQPLPAPHLSTRIAGHAQRRVG